MFSLVSITLVASLLPLSLSASQPSRSSGWCDTSFTANPIPICGQIHDYPTKGNYEIDLNVPFYFNFSVDANAPYNVSCKFSFCPPVHTCGVGNCSPMDNDAPDEEEFTMEFQYRRDPKEGTAWMEMAMGFNCPGTNPPYGGGFIANDTSLKSDNFLIPDGTSLCFVSRHAPPKPLQNETCAQNGTHPTQHWTVTHFMLEALVDPPNSARHSVDPLLLLVENNVNPDTTPEEDPQETVIDARMNDRWDVALPPLPPASTSSRTTIRFRVRNEITGLELTCEHVYEPGFALDLVLQEGNAVPVSPTTCGTRIAPLVSCGNVWDNARLTDVAELNFAFDVQNRALYLESEWYCYPDPDRYYTGFRNTATGCTLPYVLSLECDPEVWPIPSESDEGGKSLVIRCAATQESMPLIPMDVVTKFEELPIP